MKTPNFIPWKRTAIFWSSLHPLPHVFFSLFKAFLQVIPQNISHQLLLLFCVMNSNAASAQSSEANCVVIYFFLLFLLLEDVGAGWNSRQTHQLNVRVSETIWQLIDPLLREIPLSRCLAIENTRRKSIKTLPLNKKKFFYFQNRETKMQFCRSKPFSRWSSVKCHLVILRTGRHDQTMSTE